MIRGPNMHSTFSCDISNLKNRRKLSLIDILGIQPRIQSVLNDDIG